MTIVNFTPASALAGGALIGLAAAGLWWMLGRLAGVSSILGGVFSAGWKEMSWRLAFLAGLLASGALAIWLVPGKVQFDLPAGLGQVVLAGVLVGIGTQVGGGCTSGHGICGVSRLSFRSIVATLIFMTAGMVTVYVWMHVR
jgi:uncharacterized protein